MGTRRTRSTLEIADGRSSPPAWRGLGADATGEATHGGRRGAGAHRDRGDVRVGRAVDACEAGRGDDTALADTVDAADTGHDADPDDMERGRTLRAAEAELVTDVPSQAVGAEAPEHDLVGRAREAVRRAGAARDRP